MSAYIIFIREKARDHAVLGDYSKASPATLAGHDVKALAVYGKHEELEGAASEGVVLLEFPTMDAAKAWYDSPAYRSAREIRFKGADYRCILFQGL